MGEPSLAKHTSHPMSQQGHSVPFLSNYNMLCLTSLVQALYVPVPPRLCWCHSGHALLPTPPLANRIDVWQRGSGKLINPTAFRLARSSLKRRTSAEACDDILLEDSHICNVLAAAAVEDLALARIPPPPVLPSLFSSSRASFACLNLCCSARIPLCWLCCYSPEPKDL